MITLALAQMMYFFYLQAPFTGGEDGIPGRTAREALRSARPQQRMGDVFAGVGGVRRRVSPYPSRSALAVRAGAEGDPRKRGEALSLGYDVNRYKLLAYVLSATLAGLAGATKVLVFELASLTDVHWTMSGEVVLMVLLGGLGPCSGRWWAPSSSSRWRTTSPRSAPG